MKHLPKIAAAAAVGLAAAAHAQLALESQYRSFQGRMSSGVRGSFYSTDPGPYDDTVRVVGDPYYGWIDWSEYSLISQTEIRTDDRLTLEGGHFQQGGSGEYHFFSEFYVESPTAYTLTGACSGSDLGGHAVGGGHFAFTQIGVGTIFEYGQGPNDAEWRSFQLSGVFQPGSYSVLCEAWGMTTDINSITLLGSFILTVPSPGTLVGLSPLIALRRRRR